MAPGFQASSLSSYHSSKCPATDRSRAGTWCRAGPEAAYTPGAACTPQEPGAAPAAHRSRASASGRSRPEPGPEPQAGTPDTSGRCRSGRCGWDSGSDEDTPSGYGGGGEGGGGGRGGSATLWG